MLLAPKALQAGMPLSDNPDDAIVRLSCLDDKISSPLVTPVPRPPKIRGWLDAPKASLSLSSLLPTSPSPSSSPLRESPPASPSENLNNADYGPRRKVRSRPSRIARPKDALPFARHRAARTAARFKGRGNHRGTAANCGTAVPVLDRSKLVPGAASGYDEVADNELINENEELSGVSPAPPLCLQHVEPCALLACRRGVNAGRNFFKCARPRYQQCDFFKWADEVARAVAQVDEIEEDETNLRRARDLPPWKPAPAVVHEHMSLDDALEEVFGFESWRPGQREAVTRLLNGDSVLAVLPTAAGKSLIYQTVAAICPGLVLIVTPLVALIRSQCASAPKTLSAASLCGDQSREEIMSIERNVRNGNVKLLFVAPERLYSRSFQSLMSPQDGVRPTIALVVIDEAHCVSQWGHNFRTAYLRLSTILIRNDPDGLSAFLAMEKTPILALTATATIDTQRDICKKFRIDLNHGVVRCNAQRSNLSLTLSAVDNGLEVKAAELVKRLNSEPFSSILGIEPVAKSFEDSKTSDLNDPCGHECDDKELTSGITHPVRKRRRTSQLSRQDSNDDDIGWGSNTHATKYIRSKGQKLVRATGCIIVYVNKQRDCESVRNFLMSSSLPFKGNVTNYHGGMSYQERSRVQACFEKGRISVLVATIAFGLGVHSKRVSGIIHFDPPSSIESYAQEIGRAGRDGRPAHCHIFFNELDGMRLLSRSHFDGIDLNTIRLVIRSMLDNQFAYHPLLRFHCELENSTSLKNLEGVNSNSHDKRGESQGKIDGQLLDSVILTITEDELCKSLDVKLETGETIGAILESQIRGICVKRTCNSKIVMRFFSESAEALLKSKSKALNRYDKKVLETIQKHSKRSNGQFTLLLSQAGVTEDQISFSLKRLQSAGLLSFEASDPTLQLLCSKDAAKQLREEIREWSSYIYNELLDMEKALETKARILVGLLCEADQLLSDREQSSYLHKALDRYFAEGHEAHSLEYKPKPCSVERTKEVRNAANYVCNDQSCGSALARTGRQVARVLHGMDGGRLCARDWWQCKQWGRYVDVDFETVRNIACEVIRERLKLRKDMEESKVNNM